MPNILYGVALVIAVFATGFFARRLIKHPLDRAYRFVVAMGTGSVVAILLAMTAIVANNIGLWTFSWILGVVIAMGLWQFLGYVAKDGDKPQNGHLRSCG